MTDKLTLSFEKLEKALTALEITINKPSQEDRINIDACIQRFEFVFELSWLLLKRVIQVRGKEVAFPKDVLKEAYASHLIDDEALWLQMLNDRNQSSHTYDEELADKIYANIKIYFPVLKKTYQKLFKNYLPTPQI